jgi:hypothetical protein
MGTTRKYFGQQTRPSTSQCCPSKLENPYRRVILEGDCMNEHLIVVNAVQSSDFEVNKTTGEATHQLRENYKNHLN